MFFIVTILILLAFCTVSMSYSGDFKHLDNNIIIYIYRERERERKKEREQEREGGKREERERYLI